MQVLSINIQHNNQAYKQTNRNRTFKGSVDKSVYRYLDKVCHETADVVTMKNEIIENLNTFMSPLHKDTIFSIKNIPAIRTYLLPFPKDTINVAYELVDIGNYQTFFSNKKTKTSFSLSERYTFVHDKNSKSYIPPEKCIWKSWQEDKLSAFKSHVEAVIKFFDKDRGYDVDNVLYNNRFVKRPLIESFLPKFIVRRRIERDKKLAPEFQKFYSNEDVYIYNFLP